MTPSPSMSLAGVVKFLIVTLTRWATVKRFGKITIITQAGQIKFVHVEESYASEAPAADARGQADVERVVRELTTV